MRPIIFREGAYTHQDIKTLQEKNRVWEVKDIYRQQLVELYEISNPSGKFFADYRKKLLEFIRTKTKKTSLGDWIYFPWSGYLLHTLCEKEYNLIRTNRNQLIITEEEQKKLLKACLGFVGLSIGSHFAIGAAYNGIASHFKIADFDTLSTSNLNRIHTSIQNIGLRKTDLTSRAIYEINPYAHIESFHQGLTDECLKAFFKRGTVPDVVFEAIDDFQMKIKLRLFARKVRVPVIMLTNLGDNILIDIERYDLEKNLPLFNGLLGDTPEKILQAKITEKEKIEFAIKIVGEDHLPTRVLQTLFEINKSLVGRPQTYSTVTVAGGIASYLIRRIILKESLPSGRTFISFTDLF